MKKEVVILIAEDDVGHATLIQKNLRRSGIENDFIHFKDGQEVLDFLSGGTQEPHLVDGTPYLLLLDISMPRVDGVAVLRQVKEDEALRAIPVIMLTTTDDPREIERCYNLGASSYISKPVEYDRFAEAIQELGLFLQVVAVPGVGGEARCVSG